MNSLSDKEESMKAFSPKKRDIEMLERNSLSNSITDYEPAAILDETLPTQTPLPPQISLFKGQVILNPTISRINFAAYLMFSTYLSLVMLPAGLLTLPLLKIVYGLSSSEAVTAAGVMQLCQFFYKIFAFPILGAMCDKHGRKPFIVIGVILLNTGIILSPRLPNVYPFYIIVAIVQDVGLTCLVICPLLADYVDYETKGRVAGIAGVLNQLASFISTYITSIVDIEDNIPSEYLFIGIFGFVAGAVILLGIKGGTYHKALFYDKKAEEAKQRVTEMVKKERQSGGRYQDFKINQAPQNAVTENDAADPDEKPGFKVGIREAKRCPWILMGYFSNFLNVGITVIINGVLVNWAPAVTGNEDDATQAYNLANKQVLAALISVFFFGYAVDKLDKFKILVSTILLAMVACVLLVIAPSPFNFLAYISVACFGMASAGLGTFGDQVLSKYPNPKYRASVGALGGLCSLLGQVCIGIVGIILSQLDVLIPFYLYFGVCAIMLVIITKIYAQKKDTMSKL